MNKTLPFREHVNETNPKEIKKWKQTNPFVTIKSCDEFQPKFLTRVRILK